VGFDAEIKVRVSAWEKQALADIAAERRGNVKPSVIAREAIQEYLERAGKSPHAMAGKIGAAAKVLVEVAEKKKQAARKRAA
jgi:hypothetical protein